MGAHRFRCPARPNQTSSGGAQGVAVHRATGDASHGFPRLSTRGFSRLALSLSVLPLVNGEPLDVHDNTLGPCSTRSWLRFILKPGTYLPSTVSVGITPPNLAAPADISVTTDDFPDDTVRQSSSTKGHATLLLLSVCILSPCEPNAPPRWPFSHAPSRLRSCALRVSPSPEEIILSHFASPERIYS